MGAPPDVCRKVLFSTYLLLNTYDKKFSKMVNRKDHDQWKASIQMMANPGEFVQKIKSLDARTLTGKQVNHSLKILADLTPERTKNASQAAASLHEWVLGVTSYWQITHEHHEETKEEESPHKEEKEALPEKKEHHQSPHANGTNSNDVQSQQEQKNYYIDCITPRDIVEIKTLSKPPVVIKDLLFVVYLLMHKYEKKMATLQKNGDHWKASSDFLKDPQFLRLLKELDIEHIKPKSIAIAEKHFKESGLESPERVMKVSNAAGNLCQWALAVIQQWKESHPHTEESPDSHQKPELLKRAAPPKGDHHENESPFEEASNTDEHSSVVEMKTNIIKSLDTKDIQMLKSLSKPPAAIAKIVGTVVMTTQT